MHAIKQSRLNLIVEDVSESNPHDLAYTYSGYAPLSCRLVEAAVRSGWKSCEDALKLLPGRKSALVNAAFGGVLV
eukprot:scaffold251553_cov20-Prasinocladus_malaysianus.AAC.1